jgi:hypothetical protein
MVQKCYTISFCLFFVFLFWVLLVYLFCFCFCFCFFVFCFLYYYFVVVLGGRVGFHYTCINDDSILIIEQHSNIWFEYPRVIYYIHRCWLRMFVHNSIVISSTLLSLLVQCLFQLQTHRLNYFHIIYTI